MKQLDNLSGLKEGAARARRENRPVLVSRTAGIPSLDPLSFFASGARWGARNFWSDPDRELTLVGVGAAWRAEAVPMEDRYRAVEREWEELLANAVREPADPPRGAGPLLLGGFSFDPLRTETPLWEGFSEASFILPRFMLSVRKERCLLTVNARVEPGDDPEEMAEALAEEEEELIRTAATLSVAPSPSSYDAFEVEPERWKESVSEAARHIREENLEKVVLARELRLRSEEPFAAAVILKRLQQRQPGSFLFAMERSDACFLGASPERLVKKDDDRLYSTCLAGTAARGATPEEDRKRGEELLADPKNREEHAVVVHMIAEAFREGCGEVRVPDTPTLYRVRDVQHLFTPVEGRSKPDTTLLAMVRRLHPTPAMGGYPQQAALDRIRETEGMDRGWYAAPLGWLDFRGDGEFICGIRSGLLRGRTASLFAGCGIVGDSDPDSEYEETRMKFRPMLSALGGEGR
ncbi:isochorismate synthase [Melghirimyces profundicolus]|nr:isochorismate synthase [Melghirimyces profundicolus]